MALHLFSWLIPWRKKNALVPISSDVAPLVLPSWAAWAEEPEPKRRVSRSRPLAIQLATVARMNVPAGRKAFGAAGKPVLRAKPIAVAVAKRALVARSVHLQARHKMIKPSVLKPLALVHEAPRSADNIAAAIAA